MSDFNRINKREALVLFMGDVFVLYLSLALTLFLRYFNAFTESVWELHAVPFSILFVVWVVVYFIAGLYEKHTIILKNRLPSVILNSQITNSAIAILFFYLIPYFGITPKTILFIYLLVSFVLIVLWRRFLAPRLSGRRQQKAIIIGTGKEVDELVREVNDNPRYGITFISSIDLDAIGTVDFTGEVVERVYSEGITTIVIDTKNDMVTPILPKLYNLIFSHVRFIDMHKVYEDIFDRVPLSLVEYSWFLENISVTRKFTYEFLKRLFDIVIAAALGIVSLIAYPFIMLAIKLDDGGPVFYVSERVGKNNKLVRIVKFRTMTGRDVGKEVLSTHHRTTAVGHILRALRLDELPQLFDVVMGDLSLIGPRPEYAALVEEYARQIPYYNVRHLIKPGLSGWGVLHDDDVPRGGTDVDRTRRKLSYDLYYIKNRSFLLDVTIALKTLRRVLSRTGR